MDGIMGNLDKLSPADQVNVLGTAAVMYQIAKPTPMVDKAYAAYKRWIAIQPDNLEALNNLACLLADNYNPPRTRKGSNTPTRPSPKCPSSAAPNPGFWIPRPGS